MCGPLAVPIIMAASAAVGAYATYQSGQTQKTFAQYEAAQGEANAKAEKGDAQVQADRIRKAGKMAAEEANAAVAASGQDLASAGALAINREVYRGAEEDAYFALLGGKDRAAQLTAQAQLTRAKGQAAGQAGTLGAFSQALQGASNTYSAWRTAKKA